MTLPLDVVMVFTVGVITGVICANHWHKNGRPDANQNLPETNHLRKESR